MEVASDEEQRQNRRLFLFTFGAGLRLYRNQYDEFSEASDLVLK